MDSLQSLHKPILVGPIVDSLLVPFLERSADATGHWIVDCTLGGGGHTGAILKAFSARPECSRHRILAVDQDERAIARARVRFADELREGRLELFHGRFSEALKHLAERSVLGIMADLGFSSDQLEDPERGISFQREGPLDMRLDTSRGESAFSFLARASEKDIADTIWKLGEERFSRRIARQIVERRQEGRLPTTTSGLAELVLRAFPSQARHGRIHAATRTFQALRIHVNEELEELDSLLSRVILEVKPGGRIAILSFHSLEDRRVKQAFRDQEGLRALTKKPLEADEQEVLENPRARSAKLRIAERI